MSQAVAVPSAPAPFADADNPFIPRKGARFVRIWLLVVAVMVYAMILVGGATRLTDSGLSITEWKPLLGAFPPLSDRDWSQAFAKYVAMTAQARDVNAGMTMSAFKGIYWWEWSHRELGRSIGLVFGAPLALFWATGRTTRRLLPHLIALFLLGGLQGLIGWWMVASGVGTDLVKVAPYRLMTHFCLALFIIAYCLWLWFELGSRKPAPSRRAFGWAAAMAFVVALQMALGALVAGLDAGRGYTDWPLMAGRIFPQAFWGLQPWWRNFFENEATTQFLHRINAYALLGVTLAAAWRFRREPAYGFNLVAFFVSAQAMLGVVTLMNAAPLSLSLAHQALGTAAMLTIVRLVWITSSRAGQRSEV